jgi:glycosyltransferase involved in cell wall biosynthesis
VTSVAIVQDHLVQRGGAERVLLSMSKALPSAPIYTSFYWPEACYGEFEQLDVRPARIDNVPGLRRRHRLALPVLPFVFDRMRIDADVVVCGTSGWAAGAPVSGRKILYFHSLARWLHERESYLAESSLVQRAGSGALAPWLRRWDRAAVQSGHRYLVYSSSMAHEVRRVYGIDAEVLAPPVTVDAGGPERAPASIEPGFVLCPCRLMSYKNVDAVIEAFRGRPGDRLVVAGGGPEEARLRALAPTNVTLLGQVDDAAMRWLYRRCRAVVSAAFEPFGLITLEANAFGRPAVVLRRGGFEDTVVEGSTGTFFDELTPSSVDAALDALDALDPDEDALRSHAAQWSEARFIAQLQAIVAEESGH